MNPVNPTIELEYFLKKVPLFSSIPKKQLGEIASCFIFKEFKKEETICRQGDPSDAMYIIRSGGVTIQSNRQGQSMEIELRRGDFFGEMALLSDRPRSATIKANLDTTLFKLHKKDFEFLLKENRHIGLFLSRLYARRLSTGHMDQHTGTRPGFYTLSATQPQLGLSHFLYSVSYHIATESTRQVLVVEPHLELEQVMKKYGLGLMPCPDDSLFELLPPDLYNIRDFKWFQHPSGFMVLQVNKGFSDKLVPVLSLLMESLKNKYDIIFFSLGHHFDNLEQQAVRLCDKNLLLINNTPGALEKVRQKLQQLEEFSGSGFDKIRVGVSHLCGTTGIARETLKKELNLSETPQIWVDRCDRALNDMIDTQKRFPIKGARSVAREIAGVRIGLALGAGSARGWAHIGVLKTLKEHNIHVDMIAGTSMGALVGAIYSATGSVDHLIKNTIAQFPTRAKARRKIFDYTFPLRGFLRGKKALKMVSKAIKDADFMDLMIPTFLVSVDILRGEEILFETGNVAKAVRSSLSLPAVFSPVRHRGRWLVDGGLLNPVPVDILEQKGADKIIAVCAEPPNASSDHRNRAPRLMEIITRTMRIVHQRATSGFAQKSDIVIYPNVQEFAWDDFHRGQEIMKKGEDACEQVLSEIKTLLQ